MQRPTIRLAGRLAFASALLLALLTPAAVLAADPAGGPTSSSEGSSEAAAATPSPSGSDQVISIDPTFITSTATPSGAILSATGRPERTLPPTDTAATSNSAGVKAQGPLLLLLLLATISLVAARLPEVRRR
ncbi:MAG: hypothetical protein ACYDAN_03870 [Candidatus Limnocylindrales bacterium]